MLPSKKKQPETINDYISAFPPDTQAILTRLRQRIHGAAPNAREAISYGLPTFKMRGVLVSFGAFKKHIGFYPPIHGDKKMTKALAPYLAGVGNLQFPLDQPIPYDLIERIVMLRASQDAEKAKANADARAKKSNSGSGPKE